MHEKKNRNHFMNVFIVCSLASQLWTCILDFCVVTCRTSRSFSNRLYFPSTFRKFLQTTHNHCLIRACLNFLSKNYNNNYNNNDYKRMRNILLKCNIHIITHLVQQHQLIWHLDAWNKLWSGHSKLIKWSTGHQLSKRCHWVIVCLSLLIFKIFSISLKFLEFFQK